MLDFMENEVDLLVLRVYNPVPYPVTRRLLLLKLGFAHNRVHGWHNLLRSNPPLVKVAGDEIMLSSRGYG